MDSINDSSYLTDQAREQSSLAEVLKECNNHKSIKLENTILTHPNQVTQVQAENDFKRKTEEAQTAQKRLKDALDFQKEAVHEYREKNENAKADLHAWEYQELEVMLSTVEAECTLERLREDKVYLTRKLADLQLQNGDNVVINQEHITELMEFVKSRNMQIEQLEEHVKESKEENRAKAIWHIISTMTDTKEALQCLMKITASKIKEYTRVYNLLTLKYMDLAFPKDTVNDSEKDKLIAELQMQCNSYKEQLDNLQNKVLTEKNMNVKEKKKKAKTKQKEVAYEAYEDVTSDESIDNDENDPDWQLKMENKSIVNRKKKITKGCGCVTKCSTRCCICKKNNVECTNCKCDPDQCRNKNIDL